jgi:hypothetical protein
MRHHVKQMRNLLTISLILPVVTWGGAIFVGCQTASAQMLTPPPVSSAQPVEARAEKRTNYLKLGMTLGASYINNLYAGTTPTPLAETTFTIFPTISLDQSRSIQHLQLTYHPGFTFYTPTSSLNEVDQSANAAYRRQLTRHTTVRVEDEFEDSSTSFSPGGIGIGGATSIGSLVSVPGVIPPFAQRLTNDAYGQWTWQTGPSNMIGFEGTSTVLHYPNPGQATGLFDTYGQGGSAFLSRHIARRQYVGGKYIYSDSIAEVPTANVNVRTHTVAGFYTLYLSKDASLSLMGGPERYIVHQSSFVDQSAWTPAVSVAFNRQGQYLAYSIGYAQSVAGGGGLAGAYYSKAANATAQWQISRRLIAGIAGSYADNKAVAPVLFVTSESGHSIMGSAYCQYIINSHLYIRADYQRIHESYANILAVHNNPDSGRVAMSITWEAIRPFGE